MNRKINHHTNRGFTFIELLLYISIVTAMITTIILFAWNVIGSGAKSATQQEVFSQARFVSERIKYEIRNASGINSVSATAVSLSETVSANNPTVIDIDLGNVRIKQGAGAVVILNSVDTTISNFAFTNYTSADNKTKQVGFSFTISDAFSSDRQEFAESLPIRGSAEVRSN